MFHTSHTRSGSVPPLSKSVPLWNTVTYVQERRAAVVVTVNLQTGPSYRYLSFAEKPIICKMAAAGPVALAAS